MRGKRLLAALSLGAAGFAQGACGHEPHGPTLIAAVGGRRLVEPRLSGGFAHAACQEVSRGHLAEPNCSPPPPAGTSSFTALAKVKKALDRAVERAPSPKNFAAHGILLLLTGDRGEKLDRAVSELERAAAAAPRDAWIASDLAAAYLVRAERRDDPYDLTLAFSAARDAVRIDDSLPEARFNQALILERLLLDGAARDAWQAYLALDAQTAWAAEARKHLSHLTPSSDAPAVRLDELAATGERAAIRRFARAFPDLAEKAAEADLLGRWADLYGKSAEAAAYLAGAREVGAGLAEASGERMIADSVAAIDAAVQGGDDRRLRDLAAGHAAYRDGLRLYDSRTATMAAAAALGQARARLSSAASPFALQAAFYLACCEYYRGRNEVSLAALDEVEGQIDGRPYSSLRGYIDWMRGYLRTAMGDPAAGNLLYGRSVVTFEHQGEFRHAASVRPLLAENLKQLGSHREAWKQIYRALTEAPGFVFNAYGVAATAALEQGQTELSLHFEEEVARNSTNLMSLPDSLFRLGSLKARLGRTEEAEADFNHARRLLRDQPEDRLRRVTQANLDRVEGELLKREPGRAIDLLTSALEYYRSAGQDLLALQVYRARAEAYRRKGDLSHAAADLRAGLATCERDAHTLSLDEHFSFLAETAKLFDEMAELEIAQGRPDLAFVAADRSQSLTPFAGGVEGEMTADEVCHRLPDGVTLVEYRVLPDRLLLWQLRRGGWRFQEVPIGRLELERRVAELVQDPAGKGAREAWVRTSSDLFESLVRPALPLGDNGRLVFIPDKALHGVPFACLWDRERGRYLVEDHPSGIAPSARIYLTALERDRQLGRRPAPPAVLVVGAPAFDRNLFQDLQDLPYSAAEAQAIAALYPGAQLLLDRRADKATFLALAQRASLIQFGGHAVLNETKPLLSMLVLAPAADGGSGALYARDIFALRFPATRLVALAACSTAGLNVHGEGAASLGRAFLAAGVPTVVASLRRVDDAITARLFQAFHQHLRSGVDPAEALRRAQISILTDPRPPTSRPLDWGAFEVIGAGVR